MMFIPMTQLPCGNFPTSTRIARRPLSGARKSKDKISDTIIAELFTISKHFSKILSEKAQRAAGMFDICIRSK